MGFCTREARRYKRYYTRGNEQVEYIRTYAHRGPVTLLSGSACRSPEVLAAFQSECARAAAGVALGGVRRRDERRGSASGTDRRLRPRGSVWTRFLTSFHCRLRAPGGRERRRGTGEGAGVAGGKERTGERRPESSEGGKMADRFSRFNEDRDFQVNRGVAEDSRKALAEPEPSPLPLPALFPSRFLCGYEPARSSPAPDFLRASWFEARPHFFSSCILLPRELRLPDLRLRLVWGSVFETPAWSPEGDCFPWSAQPVEGTGLGSPGKRGLAR